MAPHVIVSRLLIIAFALGITVLDFWYYWKKVGHPTRWVKLAYSSMGMIWLGYTTFVLAFPDDQYQVMASVASPLIAYTLGCVLSGSILRAAELWVELKKAKKA